MKSLSVLHPQNYLGWHLIPFAFSCPLCSGFLSAFVSDVKAAPCKAPGLPLGALWTWSHRTEVIDHSFVKKQPHCHSESVPSCLQAAATFQGGFSGWWWPLKAQVALVSCSTLTWSTISVSLCSLTIIFCDSFYLFFFLALSPSTGCLSPAEVEDIKGPVKPHPKYAQSWDTGVSPAQCSVSQIWLAQLSGLLHEPIFLRGLKAKPGTNKKQRHTAVWTQGLGNVWRWRWEVRLITRPRGCGWKGKWELLSVLSKVLGWCWVISFGLASSSCWADRLPVNKEMSDEQGSKASLGCLFQLELISAKIHGICQLVGPCHAALGSSGSFIWPAMA